MYIFNLQLNSALCSFAEEIQAQDFNIFNINEVIIQTKTYLSFP